MERRKRKKQKNKSLIILNSLLLIACIILFSVVFFYLKNTTFSSSKANNSIKQTQTKKTTTNSNNSANKVSWEKQTEEVKFPILMYHAIHNIAPEESSNANLIVAPELFEEHIKALKDDGYYFLTPKEAYKVLTENVLPNGNKKIVWLTFDDSLEDFYTQAYPILTKYKAHATNNVITGMTVQGLADHLTLPQMKEMVNNGIALQSHTVNHPDLSQQSYDVAESEMKEADEYLDENFNQDTIAIAYPAGRYSDETLEIAKKYYKLGVTTNEGLASKSDGLLSLNRVRILPTTTAQSLLEEIAQ